MSRSLIFAAIVLTLALTGVAWWWSQRVDHPPITATTSSQAAATTVAGPSQTDGGDVDAASSAMTLASPPRVSSPTRSAPAAASTDAYELPAADLPLRETAAALIEAHRAGQLRATQRLLAELTECQRYRWASLRMDMMIAWDESPRGERHGGDRLKDAMNATAATVGDLAERCAGVPEDLDEALLFEVQRRAADGGDLTGQLAFAVAPAMSLINALQKIDRLTIYQQQAPQFLQRALEQGSGQAVAAFMDGYEYYFEGWRGASTDGTSMQAQAMRKMMRAVRPLTPLQQVLGEDLGRAYQYALLCKRVCNGTDQARAEAAIHRLSVSLDADAMRQAKDRADALCDAHFGARPRPEDVDLDAMQEAVMGFRR